MYMKSNDMMCIYIRIYYNCDINKKIVYAEQMVQSKHEYEIDGIWNETSYLHVVTL